MVIVWPDNTEEIINSIRDAIGRDVEFIYIDSTTPCSGCSLDPVTNTSDDSFCPICSGLYWIETISGYTTEAVITWSPSDRYEWASGGTLSQGDCIIQVELDSTIEDIIPKTKEVIVDNRTMEIKKQMRRGVKPLNRILLSLIEKENNS
jgi:hypothetical protein